MSVNEVLTVIVQVFFVALSTVALFDYIRHPNRRRRDFVLFSSALGMPLGVSLLKDLFGFESGLLDLLGALALFAQPYFLFRLVQYYRPSRWWLHWVVLGGMFACWIILFVFFSTYPRLTQVTIFGYCVVVDAYCTWRFSRGLRSTVGTLRHRLLLITVGAGLFTLALAGTAITPIVPSLAQPIGGIALSITAISAVLYYVAFTPPRWIRNAWQFEDLREFLARHHDTTTSGLHVSQNSQRLASAANQAINGVTGSVFHRNDESATWTALGATDVEIANQVIADTPHVLDQVWQQRQPLTIHMPDIRDAAERGKFEAIGELTWLFVPITSAERIYGVLLVTLHDRSLFMDDDLALLELFAQQAAIVQENELLVTALQGYSQQLADKVEERTTELRESETALRELNATLEERVEQRTAELQQRNDELDSFTYVASHDLKAPLRAINHLADWIAEDAGELLPEGSRQHLSKLQGRVHRMEALLNDLLAYSRVGRQRHPAERVNLTELIQDVSEVCAPPPGFTIKTDTDLVLETERIPLEVIFRNLIGNAIKHHDRAYEGKVEILAEEHPDHVKFVVSDDGPGIPAEYHQRIFDIFTTLVARDQLEASGIGLAIVKKSVESRGGTVWVESAEGQGTTVHFTWPQNGEYKTP